MTRSVLSLAYLHSDISNGDNVPRVRDICYFNEYLVVFLQYIIWGGFLFAIRCCNVRQEDPRWDSGLHFYHAGFESGAVLEISCLLQIKCPSVC